mmetsp:Transcript_11820/g.14701  ORF Transcript_11820/g.14701 Transcript_11820/m.14701 type:complete len:355 (-) Transcript_11820:592-1656(-)
MSNAETFLESFIEKISTLPSEMKRNLAHMRSLDRACSKVVQELRDSEEDYLEHAYNSINQFSVHQNHEHDENKKKRKIQTDCSEQNLEDSDKDENREKDSDDDDDKTSSHNDDFFWHNPKQGIPVKTKVKSSSSSSPEEKTILVIPTTEELNSKIRNHQELFNIAKLRTDARQLIEEKCSISDQTCLLLDAHIKRLDDDLEKFQSVLKNSGRQYEAAAGSTGAQPDDLAAIQVTPNSPDWILAKVITHDPQTQMYKLADEDIESNKTFTLPESQVVILGLGGLESIRKSDIIYAVYPDTTSFYQATVVQGPKKVAGGDSFVLVHFKDDGDENGITHDKAVLMKHVMRVPYGAIF